MDRITISNGTTILTLPRTTDVSDAGEVEYKEATMASGLIVRDIIGFRPGYKLAWDDMPAEIVSSLCTLLRTGGFFTVNYFDVDGTAKTGMFSITYPNFKVFKFDENGLALWHECSITIKSQGVV